MGDHPIDDDDALTTDPLTETTRIPLKGLMRQAAGGRPRLVVVEGGALGTMVEIGEKPVSIGREADNTLPILAVGVSRRHAIVRMSPEGVVVEDLGSKNGTYVDKQAIKIHKLKDGDLIFVGAATLKFLAAENVERMYYDYLYEVSAHDGLTGLANRRAFDEFLERELKTLGPSGDELALLVIDIDHFKRINDTHGHLGGDEILKEIAEVMRGQLGSRDFLCRYGGEEFAVVLPRADKRDASILADRLRIAVEKNSFVYLGAPVPVTISVGGAIWSADMREPDDLIAVADEKLYAAKTGGRNRCEL